MNLIPADVDFRANAAASAVRVRGAEPLVATTQGKDVSVALKCVGAYQGWQTAEQLQSLDDEGVAAPLIAAARTLLSVAEESRNAQGEIAHAADGLALHAAVAFGMHGNFPSAKAALRVASPAYLHATKIRQITAAICDPIRAEGESGTSADVTAFCAGWRRAIVGGDAAAFEWCLNAFPDFIVGSNVSDRALLLSVELAARQAFRLSISQLRSEAPELPVWFVDALLQSGMRTLLPPQWRLLARIHLAATSGNTLLNLPTSTGKTLLALARMAVAVASGGMAVFVAPYVAIGEQVHAMMQQLFLPHVQVVAMFGGFRTEAPTFAADRPQVIVATPERFDGLLRTQNLNGLLKLVILDEFHIVENGARGARVEGIVSRLRLQQASGFRVRLMALSAVLPEASYLRNWLGVAENDFHRIGWRPTARRLAVCRSDGTMFWMHGTDTLKPAEANAGASIGGVVSVQLPSIVRPATVHPSHSASLSAAQNVVAVALDLTRRLGGSGLIVCPRRADTRTVANALVGHLPAIHDNGSLVELAERIVQRHPWLASLGTCLRHGVAFHNASLPFDVRRDIELATRKNWLTHVASTTTLAEGADLPFRWTLLAHWLTGVHEGARPVKAVTFRNIAGRSGRANAYTEGDTVVFENLLGHAASIGDRQTRTTLLGKLLFDQSHLTSTVETSALGKPDEELRPVIEANLASQLLAAIPENPLSENIYDALARCSYAWASGAGEEAIFLYHRLMGQLLDSSAPGGALAVVNSPARLTPFGAAANQSGFSPGTCREIVRFISSEQFPSEPAILLENVLVTFSQIPEQSDKLLRKICGDGAARSFMRTADIRSVIEQWLSGRQPREIFDDLPKRKSSTAQQPYVEAEFDKFIGMTDAVLRSFLPWLLRAIGTLCDFGSLQAAFAVDWRGLANSLETVASQNDPLDP
ncbi:DEAD/DEAH box helicase [Paraburkholderia bonniea]|uniref:DEAD/DEAH box helicase n=1 Tax=Paraburkholderia bonniea TaxID=2152891 RepID=UPI002572C487|nr:DEAD/DEAH box helicase [Paraburkholderia bonniea]WJF89743.1 DEAD/DEAH box helicase [Paraburkholderia bonniea]WJF93057.1 DEAD/DEAH box helicase [Paraburkholderia bonniea]